MRLVLLLFLALNFQFMNGCVTPPRNKEPAEYLLSTDRSTTEVNAVLKAKLAESKYTVSRENIEVGLLLFAPRGFSFENKGKKIKARQIIQVRHEGGSVKIHINYECDYVGRGANYTPCREDERPLDEKISKIESPLIEGVKNVLLKHGGTKANPTAPQEKPNKNSAAP